MFRAAGDQVQQPWGRLAAWLREHGHAVDQLDPRQFAGGAANLTYLIRVGGREVVLRRPPGGELAEGASDMAREARVLAALPAAYPLAPRGLLFCDDPSVLGAPFQLVEYRQGVSVGPDVPAGWSVDRLVDHLVEAMASLHRVDPARVGLETLGKRGFLGRQLEGWGRRASAAYGAAGPAEVGAILRWLRDRLPPEPARPSLLHCDLKLDNVLFDEGTRDPVAVVDWDMTTTGDALFDLGVLLAYWVEPGDPPELHGLRQVPSLAPDAPGRAELVRRYLDASGVGQADLSFYVTLGRLRLALAWRQLFVLHRRGALAHPRYAGFDDLATAVLGWTADTLTRETRTP